MVIPTAGLVLPTARRGRRYRKPILTGGFDVMQRPVGMCLIGGFLQERKLLALALDLEQEIQARRSPTFAGTPYQWPDAGLCAASSAMARGQAGVAAAAGLASGACASPKSASEKNR